MDDEYKKYIHTPPHLYRAGAKYFITASTYGKKKIFEDSAKEKLLFSLVKACEKRGWGLEDWVILDNHYHIMVNAPDEKIDLSGFVGEYHKFTALFIKKKVPAAAGLPKIFNNYWDSCITYESSYFARLNYLYNNPVKHGYVQLAQDYEWGSFQARYKSDKANMEKLFKDFPCDALQLNDDY